MGIHCLPARRWGRVGLVALLGLTFALVTVSEGHASEGHAVAAKKRCKKKHSRASAAKKCKKKKSAPTPVVTPPPAPLALTDPEVIQRVTQRAGEYCAVDEFCFDYGYYYDSNPSEAYCTAKSTYSWSCLGYNLEDDGVDTYACDFREIVERVGYNGITSHQDLTYGSSGWDCYLIV